MSNRYVRIITKQSNQPSAPLPSSASTGEGLINTADGKLYYKGFISGTGSTTYLPSLLDGSFFEVGAHVSQLKIDDKIVGYDGFTDFTGKFLSGTTDGFELGNISDIRGIDIFVTGGTYSVGTGTATFVNNTGGTFSVFGFASSTASTPTISSFNYTPTNNTFTITDSTGATFNATIQSVSGLTVNGVLSATTYLGLPRDIFVTGGTFSSSTATFTNNTGGTFNVTGFTSSAATIYNSNGTLTGNRIVNVTGTTTLTIGNGVNSLMITTGSSFTYYENGADYTSLSISNIDLVADSSNGVNTSTLNLSSDSLLIGSDNTSISLQPTMLDITIDGAFRVFALNNEIEQNRLIGQAGDNSRVGYVNIGNGLALSGGTLSATSVDTYVTGYTYNPLSNLLTINQNQGQSPLSFNITSMSGLSLSNLSQGRVVYVGSSGLLSDEAGFTYDTSTNTLSVPTDGSINVGTGGLNVGGNAIIQGSLTVLGASVSAFTSDLFVEDPTIVVNYNPTGNTTATSVGAGLNIQDGSGIADSDVTLTIKAMNTFTGLTSQNTPNISEYTASTGYSNRAFVTELNDIVIRSTNTSTPNGVRVLAEWDTLDGGFY